MKEAELQFPPPQIPFPPLDSQGIAGTPGSTNFANGHPYDLIDDVLVVDWKTMETQYARGGATHYSGPRQEGSYPDIDRGFYYTVDGDKVITQSFWGVNSDYYFQTLVKSNEASIWGYGAQGAYNFTQKVTSSEVKYQLWSDGGDYYSLLVKAGESSFWGNESGGNSYKVRANPSISDIQLWGNGSYTASLWITSSDAGLRLTDGDNSSYLDTGNLWLEFSGGDLFHGYGGYLYLKYAGSGAYSNYYAGGAYINNGTNWVDIQPPYEENAYFQAVLLGDMTLRYVLCSDEIENGSVDCSKLPDPVVGNIEAFSVRSSSSCGPFSVETSLDLSYGASLSFVSGSKSVVHKLDGSYYTNATGGSLLEWDRLSIWGDSGQTATIGMGLTGASVDLQDGNGNRVTANHSNINCTDGTSTANIMPSQINVADGASGQGKLWAGGLYLSDGSSWVNIAPPGEDAYFQQVTVCVNDEQKTAWVLMTEPK